MVDDVDAGHCARAIFVRILDDCIHGSKKLHAAACDGINNSIIGHVGKLSINTGPIQNDCRVVASDTITWNDGRVVARNMPTMSNTSKHCEEVTRRLKSAEQGALSTMQTMILGHDGRLESMRGRIPYIIICEE